MNRLTLTYLAVLPLLLLQVVAEAQSVNPSGTATVLRNPTPEQKKSKPTIMMASNANGSIQAAINSAPNGFVQIYLSCGIYTENIVISTSDVRLLGEERGCVQIVPADPTLPVITITPPSTSGISFDEVSDLTIRCPTGVSCSDGLRITGGTNVAQLNDFHKFSRLGVYGAFQNGINLAGRTIWTDFENIEVGNAVNGIYVVSSGSTNDLTFRNVRVGENKGYGIYVNNTQINLANGITFDTVDVENNGQNTSLANCAGIYLTGIGQANILNSYFEGNCQGNTADRRAAEVRLSGTYAQSVNITNNVFNLQYGEGGIYNDAVLSTGNYSGNKFDTSNGYFTIYIATTHPDSKIVIGVNFNSNPTIVMDGNGLTHVSTLSPLGLDYTAITSVSNNSVDVSQTGGAILYYGPYTINGFTGGHIGQLLYVTALNVSGHVLTNSAGIPGQIVFPDGLNRTLREGDGIMLYFDGNSWRPVESAIPTQAKYAVTITTTGAAADEATIPGLTEAAHCIFSARNNRAASLAGTYLTTGNGVVTFNHQAIAGAVFDVFCSSN